MVEDTYSPDRGNVSRMQGNFVVGIGDLFTNNASV
jgi:hypothetical protein